MLGIHAALVLDGRPLLPHSLQDPLQEFKPRFLLLSHEANILKWRTVHVVFKYLSTSLLYQGLGAGSKPPPPSQPPYFPADP
jgi:hypothetical protein